MSTPLWKLLRHSGQSEHYWRLIEQTHDEARLREKLAKIREEMIDGGVRLTKETVEFEGWNRGGMGKSHHGSSMTDVRNSTVKKPCAGCGETPQYGREKDKVCDYCERLLEEARKAREKADRQKGAFVALPRSIDGYSSSHERARYWEGSSEGISAAFGEMLRALAKPCSAPRGAAVSQLFDKPDQSYGANVEVVEMGKDAVKAVRELDKRIRTAIDEALRKGYEDGQNLLATLASGEISMKEFNDSVIQGKDKRRKR